MNFFAVAIFGFVLVVNALALPQVDLTKCQRACPDNYRPICGFNGHEHKVFANDCDMEMVNCMQTLRHETSFHMTSLNECEQFKHQMSAEPVPKHNKCDRICTFDYNPVCGFDGQSFLNYGNMCAFEMANCEADYKLKLTRMGECTADESVPDLNPDCVRKCPANYEPVCGFDGVFYETYGNKCAFEVQNCKYRYQLYLVRDGEC